jgi:hypothetical protein
MVHGIRSASATSLPSGLFLCQTSGAKCERKGIHYKNHQHQKKEQMVRVSGVDHSAQDDGVGSIKRRSAPGNDASGLNGAARPVFLHT